MVTENENLPAETGGMREALEKGMFLAFQRQLGNGARGMGWMMAGVGVGCAVCLLILTWAYLLDLAPGTLLPEFLIGAAGGVLAGLMGRSWCAEMPRRMLPDGGFWLWLSWGLFFMAVLVLAVPGGLHLLLGLILMTASFAVWLIYLCRVAYVLEGWEVLRLVLWWALLLGIFLVTLSGLLIYVKLLWQGYSFRFGMLVDTLAEAGTLTKTEWFCFAVWGVAVAGAVQLILYWRMRELIRQRMADWVKSEGKMEFGGPRKQTPGILPVRKVQPVEEETLPAVRKNAKLRGGEFIGRKRRG